MVVLNEMPLACRSRRRLAAKACRSSRGSIPQPDPAVAYQPTALKQQNAPAPPYNLQMECTGFERGGTWQLGSASSARKRWSSGLSG